MNATAAKGLTALKQKIKKGVRENEAILKEYKEVRIRTTTHIGIQKVPCILMYAYTDSCSPRRPLLYILSLHAGQGRLC